MENKFILDLSNQEILSEMRQLLGNNKLQIPGREKIGYITNNPKDYFINGQIDELKLKEIYNRSGKLLKDYMITLAINSLRNRKKDLFELIKRQKNNETVLDYGCGVATHGIACAQLGCKVHIMDISDPILMIAISRFMRRNLKADFHNIDLTIPYNIFDAILCTDVIEHVPNPKKMLYKFIKFLKIGGIAHLSISPHVCYERGHLKQAIDIWNNDCQKILKDKFIKISDNNYKLIKK
jgi:ubiquinone/menaquinone biosynthesis C-methylase UbiE